MKTSQVGIPCPHHVALYRQIHNIEYPISLIHQRWIIGSINGVESNGNLQIVYSEEKKCLSKVKDNNYNKLFYLVKEIA